EPVVEPEPVVELPVDEDRLIVELQDQSGEAITHMYEAEIWDVEEFEPAIDFSGRWVSECIARIVMGDQSQGGSFQYTFYFSAYSVSQEVAYYTDDYCIDYQTTAFADGTFTYSVESEDGQDIINVESDNSNLDIDGQYLISDDHSKLIMIKEDSLRLGFVKQ
ncbi:MAG TPA: hypothetical protein DDW29_04760, partial [Gammaproteobacteria bacterium]|nr:hypothetical protein [Gammaproteobacteria bacterium]